MTIDKQDEMKSSIDTNEFRDLLGDMLDAYRKELQGGPALAYEKARSKFIDYIDARLAPVASSVSDADIERAVAAGPDGVRRLVDQLVRAATAPQAAVAFVGADFTLYWAGTEPVADIVRRHGITVGSQLYAAAPAPAESEQAPTDLSKRLRAIAAAVPKNDPALVTPKCLTDAADEIDRYYGGMLAWKQTAEKKDRDWNAERMARVDERCAARAAVSEQADERARESIASNHDAMIILTQDYPREDKIRVADAHAARQVRAALAHRASSAPAENASAADAGELGILTDAQLDAIFGDGPTDEAAAAAEVADRLFRETRPASASSATAERTKLREMHNDDSEICWYFDCEGHYIDVERNGDGKYSVYFRNRNDQSEAWLDQAEPTATPASAQPAYATLDDILGPQRWAKEAEMMESWSKLGAQPVAAAPADEEHIRKQITADAECILRLLDTVDRLVGGVSGATESIQEHAQHIVQFAARIAAPAAPVLTLDNAPIGTTAPAIGGGHWYRTENGWKWNGPDGTGGTFPRPGGDWNGELIAPAAPVAPVAQANHSNYSSSSGATQAARDVLAERRRQVEAEGMTNDGDDRYHAAELPRAAAAYILNSANDVVPYIWPWAKSWWKPRDARANYVRAGALILAEIERIDRADGQAAAQQAEAPSQASEAAKGVGGQTC